MTKVAVSVSMENEMVQELKNSAIDSGENFSAHVCRLINTGRNLDRPLLAPAERLEEDLPMIPSSTEDQAADAAKAVYDQLSTERQSLKQISEATGVEEEFVGEMLDRLANDGEPIMLRVIKGEWHAWEQK